MSTYDRLFAMLRRLSPPWPSTDEDTSVGRELGSIASAMTPAAERVDDLWNELFPDRASETLARWEFITRTPIRTSDDDATRQARILSVLRRASGPRIDQLGKMLAAVMDLDVGDIQFIEQLRSDIEAVLTHTDSTVRALSGTPTLVSMGEPWPGVVDDTGVRLYVKLSALGTPTVTLTSPQGTTWTVPVDSTEDWYETRSTFLDDLAGGRWTVSAANGSAVNLEELRLLVSNDIDAAQIYNFFAYRDPGLAGTPNIPESHRLFHRTALGHMNSHVIESLAFTVDDPYSLVDRDPVGV